MISDASDVDVQNILGTPRSVQKTTDGSGAAGHAIAAVLARDVDRGISSLMEGADERRLSSPSRPANSSTHLTHAALLSRQGNA